MLALKKCLLSMPGFEGLCRSLTRRHVRVYMYHRFSDDASAGDGLQGPVFKDQLRLVIANHAVWTPEQQLRARSGKAVPGNCPVVITADDGYLDYYEVAYPILREAGVAATLFVTTGFVDGDIWMWWDKLRYLGEQAPPAVIEIALSGQQVTLDFTCPAGRRAAVRYLVNRGRFIADADKTQALGELAARLAVEIPVLPPKTMRAVDWDQILEMHRHGQLFAPHTVSHPILTRVTPERVDAEIFGSRDRLAAILGDGGRVFSYPQGGPSDYNEEVSERVRAAGFAASYLAYRGPDFEKNAFQLPRYCPNECMTSFRWSLCGAEYIGNRLRRFFGLPISIGQGYWEGQQ